LSKTIKENEVKAKLKLRTTEQPEQTVIKTNNTIRKAKSEKNILHRPLTALKQILIFNDPRKKNIFLPRQSAFSQIQWRCCKNNFASFRHNLLRLYVEKSNSRRQHSHTSVCIIAVKLALGQKNSQESSKVTNKVSFCKLQFL